MNREQGGIKLLDLKARNLAIEVTWLKSYLDLSESRPAWAYVADTLIDALNPGTVKRTFGDNIFLHNINLPSRGKRANTLPKELLNLIKTAKQVNVSFAPVKLSRTLQKQLPAWTHIGAPPNTYNARRDECLKTTHNTTTTHQLIKLAKRLRRKPNHPDPHAGNSDCMCNACIIDRSNGCKNPHKCASTANNIIKKLTPKYNPRREPKNDNL
ncbi:hypothetical protein BJ138DRAFT_1021321, partial [Hygrophoropsis aurantiaca]